MKVSILKQHMIIIITLCCLENITMTLDFHELIFLHVVGSNVNISNGWKWESSFIKQLIKELWLYNPTPNYWIRVYYTDLYIFSSLLKNSVNIHCTKNYLTVSLYVLQRSNLEKESTFSTLGFQPFIKQHST